ncbi:MAG: hypothetical protein HDR02_01410 [Lachnospiraceae bacterium]|nr:hypothetical protein [Lachnospiraceae bacterium]
MEQRRKFAIHMVFYVLIFVFTSAPVFYGYVIEGGDAALWLDRIREIKTGLLQGDIPWFPSAQMVMFYDGGAMAFDSALWLLIPAVFQLLGIGEQLAWCLFMGLVQLGTLGAAVWMARAFFRETETVLLSALFYMSCPCHLYVCYDRANLGMALVWMLCPVFIGGLVRLCNSGVKNVAIWCVTSLAYGGIWYADARFALLSGATAACSVLLWKRRIWCVLPMAAGGILGMPAVIYLVRYLIKGGMQVWNLPMGSIMKGGYAPGQYLTAWVYQPDHPGLGLGLIGAFLLLAWLRFSGDGDRLPKSVKGMLVTAGILTVLSLKYVPWDFMQRLGMPFLRYFGLLETAGVFWGCANMLLGIPAAWAVSEQRRKREEGWQQIVPLVIVLCALAAALHMCNTLIYLRPPMGQ